MKKILSLILAALLLMSMASALAEVRTKVPAGQIEGGPDVYFVITSALLKDGNTMILLGQKNEKNFKRYDQPVAITKADNDLLVPIDSLSKIFQFSYTYDAGTGAIHMEDEYVKADLIVGSKDVTINGAADTLDAAPTELEGVLCIPAVSVGAKVLGLVTGEDSGYTYLSYNEFKLPSGSTGRSGTFTPLTMPGKTFGVHDDVYWFEDAQMLMSYRLTVPTSYKPDVPSALVVFLHGSSGNDNRDVERTLNYFGISGTWWDYALNKFGFIGLSVNGYARASYGGDADSKDPIEARASELSEKEVLAAIAQVKAKYNVDDSRVFLMGNSMGGNGTVHLACKYPDMFAAISPSGAFSKPHDLTVLDGKPIRVVFGTEDPEYDQAYAAYERYKEQGINISFYGVCGAYHNNAWAQDDALTGTFQFFADAK